MLIDAGTDGDLLVWGMGEGDGRRESSVNTLEKGQDPHSRRKLPSPNTLGIECCFMWVEGPLKNGMGSVRKEGSGIKAESFQL